MLIIERLSHRYPNGVQALSDVSLDIGKGMFGLLGPNGSGKSTLMRTIATLQQPQAGTIRFGDIDVLKEPQRLREVLGYLPQDFGVYSRGSAIDILDHLAVLKGILNARERKRLVEALLVQTNLYDARNKRLSSYSGGMKRRFGIAQALIGNPKLLIVDEPTAGLDPEERNRFYNQLAEVGQDVVVLLSTHIVEDVAVLCSNLAVIADGQVVERGTPDRMKGALQGRIWQKIIEQHELDACRQRLDVISHHYAAGRLVVRVLADACPEPGFESHAASLEDVYFLATRRAVADHADTAA